MRRSFAFLLSTVALAGFAQGQTASDLNEGTRLTHDSVNDTWSFSWWGRAGRTYFIQQSDDLMSWQYIPIIEPGQEDVVEWGFATNADRLFMRLKYTDVPTLDPWGDDFDGDNIGNWDELLQESDPFATLDLNSNGIPDDWELFWDDQFGAFPKPITASLTHRESITKQLSLSNPVTPDADFTVTVSNNLAGAQVVYDYEDSLTGGAIYNWTEVSTTGTLLTGISDVVDGYEEVTLLNFAFPFYGTSHSSVFVSSNGMLAFGSGTSAYSNQSIPNSSNPDNCIAPFWDDHNTSTAGEVYVQEFSDRLIVQYEAVAPYSGTGSYTYQAVLHSSGLIEFFYKEMVGNVESATVGLENADGTDGLEIAYNEPYIQDGLAVRISQGPAYFVKVSPLSGTTTTGATSALNVTFNTFDLAPGTYTADIDIAHTGTGTTPWNVPAVLEVQNIPTSISITSPSTEAVFWMDEDADIYVSASDSDFGIERVDFYAGATFIGEDTAASYRLFNWTPPLPGTYSLTARAVDQFGTESVSNPVQVSFLADSDQDRMPDPWETDVLGSIIPEASEDHDFDGFPNIFEYHHGTDPTDPLSFPVFSETQSTVSPLSNAGEVNYYIVDGASNTLYQKSTIQSAINAAGEFDIIEVRGGVYDESLNISKRLYVFSSDGARSTIIDGGGRNDNAVYVSQESVLEGFSIQNGNRSSDGGGLYFSNSSAQNKFRLVGCLIRNNRAGDQGGAVYINYGNVTFVSCTIADNFAEQANGIYIARSSASATLVNSLIWNPGGTEIDGFTANTFQTKTILRDPISENALLDNVDTGTNNPGIGYDLALTSTSIARNAGTTFLYARRDADGELLSDGAKDIGVDEFHDSDANGLPDWLENLAGGVLVASVDGDGDSLTNIEDYIYGASPFVNDTDGDGLLDGDETFGDGTHGDTDGFVSSAKYLDADFDGMSDAWEVSYNLDPGASNNATLDGDGDGLDNLSEFNLGTNPAAVDTDGDGLSDAIESSILASIDPNNFYYLDPTNADTDGDGINDGDDSDDGDTLSNLEELALGTDLNLADTDADGVFDDVEVDIGTDPTISNDFANTDSDGDGLSDLFELNFGTDPNDADTNGNGMNDGEELDNGGDPINPGPPPPPLNPGTPPGPDPDPTPPDPIVPGDYDILIEKVSVSQPKHGFAPYQEINPTKRYLTQSSSQSFSGGCPESGPRSVSGSKTTTIDPLTGISETTGDTYVNSGGTAESPTRKSGTSQISSYDDPPNEKSDCTGTIRYNSHLSSEYTTSALISNAMSELPDYEGEFVAGTPHAYRNLHENELRYDYQSVKFKFKWHDDVTDEQRFPITYYVLWTPEDDPETQDVDESEAVEIVGTIEWSGNAAESQVYEIEPNSLKSGQDGNYSLIGGKITTIRETATAWQFNTVELEPVPTPFNPPSGVDEKTLLTSTWQNGEVKVSIVTDIRPSAANLDLVLYEIKRDANGQVVSIGNLNNGTPSSALEGNGLTVVTEFPGPFSSERYSVKIGLDLDQDEQIDYPFDESYSIGVFPQDSYVTAVAALAAALFPAGDATETILELFSGVSPSDTELPPTTQSTYTINTANTALTHKLGAPFWGPPGGTGEATIPFYIWSSASDMGIRLGDTSTVKALAQAAIDAQVVQNAFQNSQGQTVELEFNFPLPPFNSWGSDDDMNFAFGRVSMSGEISIRYALQSGGNQAVPVSATANGLIEDLTDYSYYSDTVGSVPARTAAIVQIAGGNNRAGRPAGSIFYNRVNFAKAFTDLSIFPTLTISP